MTSPILETFPLSSTWPTSGPFLMCAHHVDNYPAADDRLGPAAPLDDRPTGGDFSGTDGWNMYHGSTVPGFPQHPHRGFETITYIRSGWVDHADSFGGTARFGPGDVQWLTAGSGIVHSEMFPLLDTNGPNPLHLLQIWLNLPAANKMVDPNFSMLWSDDIPTVTPSTGVTVTAIAGELDGANPPSPPPASWAKQPDHQVAIWHLTLDPGSSWRLPTAATGVERTLYFYAGNGGSLDGEAIDENSGARVDPTRPVTIAADDTTIEVMMLQARPIGEPVAQYGPFVMSDQAEIEQAFNDFKSTGFGGWPWPQGDPSHGPGARRFAQFPDGATETPVDA
jgi:redox-sensitive bicupin YhaK (pirin superfamily)